MRSKHFIINKRIIDIFNSKAIKGENVNDCWRWRYIRKTSRGAGRPMLAGIAAARISWIIKNGYPPDGLQVLHQCDNPTCTNPEHLFLGTHKDNMRDKSNKKRYRQNLLVSLNKTIVLTSVND